MGASIKMWLKLLWQNKFNISWKYIPRTLAITLVTALFTPFTIYEHIRFNRKIRNTEIKKPPIFIVGHWRTGTTHLQNLLLLDDKYGYLDLVEATFPHLMLSGFKFISAVMKPLIPDKRPMDNMAMTAATPQEHEFAIVDLCLLSPQSGLIFPENRDRYLKYGTFEDATEAEVKEWKDNLVFYLKKLTLKEGGKQLLLKNPLDTHRVKLILEVFPDAKFINIYRNPYKVFFSTVKLHNVNTHLFWLQKPHYELNDFIFDLYLEFYDKFYQDFDSIPKDQIIELKYEDLISKPMEELEKIYEQLNLGDFELVNGKIQTYLDSLTGYQVGNYKISKKDKELIYSKWHETIDRWGYEKP
ncbi:MAG: hypothetical protein HeimAB125_06020 [Candidatus Heimdallarchaeota archaeon AB_125]|nr:MAG: hypothetical protein HeimAB125_06020 [Candidatus Heimdallarchaeota archaeon AB_125]